MLDRIRNIGIIAHVDAGKTTTTERILYYSGFKHRLGGVDTGDTTTDSDPAEKKRGITINSAAVTIDWGGNRITLIDTPGHVDFTAEVERSLRVLDGAVCVFCAVGGVQVQSETVWHQADRHGVPRLAYVNKLDRAGADFFGCVAQLRDRLGTRPVVVAIPVGQGSAFDGLIDLVEMRWVRRDLADPAGKRIVSEEVPESQLPQANLWRRQLMDSVSAMDDEILQALVVGQDVRPDLLKAALRRGTLARQFTPVLCGSSHTSQGVPLLLDCVVEFLPSPRDRGEVAGTDPRRKCPVVRRPDPDEPLAALAFKTVADGNGDMVYVRIYSGEVRPKEEVMNVTAGKRERVSRIFRMMGDRREPVDVAGPGDIVVLVGPRSSATGHTLCAPAAPIALEEIRFPEPVIAQALVPDPSTDEARLADALGRLVRDDPTLRCHTDPDTRQLIVSGMGELHLEISMEKLHRNPGIKVSLGKPMVAYRQTLSRSIEVETRYIKQSGGRGQYAIIRCRFEPTTEMADSSSVAESDSLAFVNEIVGGAVPREYVPGVEAGFRDACRKGAKFGFPCVRMRCTLLDGKAHQKDSSVDTFRFAARECTREAQERAGITLLEPIMTVVVTATEAHQGALIGDINRRRGEILNFESDRGRCQIRARVPLAELFGYASDLRNVSGGTASFSMEPAHYAPVRESLADLPMQSLARG